MTKSNKLKGKNVKQNRRTLTNENDSLDVFFEKFYEVKVSEGKAKGTLEQYKSNYMYFVEYLDV